jgi:hypothetical protein
MDGSKAVRKSIHGLHSRKVPEEANHAAKNVRDTAVERPLSDGANVSHGSTSDLYRRLQGFVLNVWNREANEALPGQERSFEVGSEFS